MWQMLIPMGMNILQEDSNRRAQIEQDAIKQKYSPWLEGNNTGSFDNQTNAGNTISAGLGNIWAAQDEQARRAEQQELLAQALNPGGYSQNLAAQDNPRTSHHNMGMQSAVHGNQFLPNKFKALQQAPQPDFMNPNFVG